MISEVSCCEAKFIPKVVRHFTGESHSACMVKDHSVQSFNFTILQQSVRCCGIVSNSILSTPHFRDVGDQFAIIGDNGVKF
jgi:hypothetical protein